MSDTAPSTAPKHTPGPYKMRRRRDDGVVELYPEMIDGKPNKGCCKLIAQVSMWDRGGTDAIKEAEGNLHLFLHATEMFEACEAALEFFDSGPMRVSRENIGLVAKLRHIVSPQRG